MTVRVWNRIISTSMAAGLTEEDGVKGKAVFKIEARPLGFRVGLVGKAGEDSACLISFPRVPLAVVNKGWATVVRTGSVLS